nr:MAG TPA: hypothetical protein [Caudoviricetes sp.]
MKQKDFDIYEILKGAPVGTPLYTPMCGNVLFSYLATNKEAGEAIWTEDKNGEYSFNKNGRWMEGGEVMLFPSKKMRDWSKLSWKKGDVLVTENGRVHIIFEKFTDYTYTIFAGKHYYSKSGKTFYYERECDNAITEEFTLETEDAAKTYISTIEKRLGGKLNRETLEVENPKKPVFELGNLYVFNEEDEDGELTIIGKLIGKNESEDTLTFGNQYEIENEKFVTDQAFDLRISVHEELREATEDEVVTFQEACTIWEKSKEQGEEQPAFKPFDKVLVRNRVGYNWQPAFFVLDRCGEEFDWRYKVLTIHRGKVAYYPDCIPYEGNEHLAFTSDPADLPF